MIKVYKSGTPGHFNRISQNLALFCVIVGVVHIVGHVLSMTNHLGCYALQTYEFPTSEERLVREEDL
jgi:hypothetical protein